MKALLLSVALCATSAAAQSPYFYSSGLNLMSLPMTDTSGSPGDASASTYRGRSAIAGSTSCSTITNPLVKATSQIAFFPRMTAFNANVRFLYIIHTGAGSFAVCSNTAAGATLAFDWFVIP